MSNAVTVENVKNFIGGQWVESTSGKTEAVPNPATGEVIAHVPLSSREDVDKAVANSAEAFKKWSKTAVPRRARILFKYQQLLVENWEELARLVTLENGKSYSEAYGEVQRGIECVEFAAGAPTLMMVSNYQISRQELNQACIVIQLELLEELHHLTSQ